MGAATSGPVTYLCLGSGTVDDVQWRVSTVQFGELQVSHRHRQASEVAFPAGSAAFCVSCSWQSCQVPPSAFV